MRTVPRHLLIVAAFRPLTREREADLAIERGVALLVGGLESRKARPKELMEKTRLPWTILRLDGPQDGGLGCGIHIEKDVRKRREASGEEKKEFD